MRNLQRRRTWRISERRRKRLERSRRSVIAQRYADATEHARDWIQKRNAS